MNKAKLIEFHPTLRAIDVNIPSDVSLIIANSLTPSPKLLTLGTRYNKRVVECRLALIVLAIRSGQIENWKDNPFKTFYDLQTVLGYTFD